jgi:TRAP-type mannitol/chloroaromatic compound transport system permease small subunit
MFYAAASQLPANWPGWLVIIAFFLLALGGLLKLLRGK